MKPQVEVTLDLGIEKVVLNFTDTDDIDRLIEVLNNTRTELERLIEMKRIKNREKRKRRKGRIDFDKPNVKQGLDESCAIPDGLSEAMRKVFLEISKKMKEDILKREVKRNPDAEKEEQLYNDIMKHYDELDDFTKSIMRPIIEQVEDAHKKFCESKKND
jgi:hypothetical protein